MKTSLNILLIVAILLIEFLIGGTRLVFSLPSYGLLGIAALLTVFKRADLAARPRWSCLAVSTLFFGYILTRAAQSPVTYLWWPDFYMVLGCLIVYLLTIFHLTGSRERAIVIWTLMVLAVIEVFVGLHQFTAGDNWMPFGFVRSGDSWRASGFLISSIHLAGYLEAVGLFALSLALWGTNRGWLRIMAGYIGLMCYLGVAVTGSRGGYLSSLFSLLVFAGLSLYTEKKVRPGRFGKTALITTIALIGSMGLAVGLMSRSDLLRERLARIPQQLEKNGLDVRIYNWQAALDQFRLKPEIGTGAGTHLYYGRYFRRPELQNDPIHAHSDYLELLAEYGWVGAVGMAAFLIVHLRSGWKNFRRFVEKELHDLPQWQPARHDALALYIGALSAIAAYLAHSVVDFNLHIPGHALIFAFIFGIVTTPADSAPAPAPSRGLLLFRWALPALGLAMLGLGLPKFPGEYYAEKARVALRDFQFDDAIQYAHQALAYEKRNPELYFTLGGAHRSMGIVSPDREERVAHFQEAIDAYLGALTLFPQDEHALIRYAETLLNMGRLREAEGAFQTALTMDRNLANLHAYYARYLAIVGRTEEAEERLAIARAFPVTTAVAGIVRGTSLDPEVNEQTEQTEPAEPAGEPKQP